jgi:NB-ARC domain
LIVYPKRKEDFSFVRSFGVCLGQAPYIDSKLFIGRDSEIDQMKEVLKPGSKSQGQQRLVLGGIGGIGKTQLAISYAKRHHNNYESVFWLNAASEATLKDSFRTIAKLVFDVQEPEVLEGEQILIQIRGWLSDKKNTQWLLIFDNYDDPDQFKIETYYPLASHGSIVVTTRQPHLVAGRRIRTQPLRSIEESLEILQTRSLRDNIKSGTPSMSAKFVH